MLSVRDRERREQSSWELNGGRSDQPERRSIEFRNSSIQCPSSEWEPGKDCKNLSNGRASALKAIRISLSVEDTSKLLSFAPSFVALLTPCPQSETRDTKNLYILIFPTAEAKGSGPTVFDLKKSDLGIRFARIHHIVH